MRRSILAGLTAVVVALSPAFATSVPNVTGAPVHMVVTAVPVPGKAAPAVLGPDDLGVSVEKTPARVLSVEPLAGDSANMQLFILLDDSTRSVLSLQFPDIRAFINSLPPTTQVAVGYMRNGTYQLTQKFTTDHTKAGKSLRLPLAEAGENGSPYFSLSDLAKHWPSKEATGRRAVLMLTDGVDRYFGTAMYDDPYVDAAVQDSLKHGLMVYSIYIRDRGFYDRGDWVTNFAQSRLEQVSNQTGGAAYFEGFISPVDIGSFLKNVQARLDHQYLVTLTTSAAKGVRAVKVRSTVSGVDIIGPTQVYVK